MRHLICFGNDLHGDDGFGPAVYRRLVTLKSPVGWRLFDAGARGLDALALFQGCEEVVLVDAAAPAGHPGRFVLLFLDLDHFKYVNDSLGHPVGNELLQAVGQRLQQTLREQDTVARLGGDEFVILLEDIDSEESIRVTAQKVLNSFARPFALCTGTLAVGTTIGIGIGLYPDHGEDMESLIKHADMALYQAKERGHGCFRFFEAQLTEQTSQRMILERDLRQVLQEQALSVRYQPVYRSRWSVLRHSCIGRIPVSVRSRRSGLSPSPRRPG